MEVPTRYVELKVAKSELFGFIIDWSKKHELTINEELELVAERLYQSLILCRKHEAKAKKRRL